MDCYDILIVGGGPAGSSCAWQLRRSGANIAILDKAVFPRDKVCGGWITPEVVAELQIDLEEYARGRTLQPITGFLTSMLGGPEVETRYGKAVSYGILRREFDEYLLRRSGVPVVEGTRVTTIERSGTEWIVNGRIRAKLLIGAGGHFCPVAKAVGNQGPDEYPVVAQEVEFRAGPACPVRGDTPELFFCVDLKGYGWCFRKGDYLNVGLGRLDRHGLHEHVADFVRRLKVAGRLNGNIPPTFPGHAYLLYGSSQRTLATDGLILIGDAAGLAHPMSGEGIRPAVESGLMAAAVILSAGGDYSAPSLSPYSSSLEKLYGRSHAATAARLSGAVPDWLTCAAARQLFATHWFTRRFVINRWFLNPSSPVGSQIGQNPASKDG